MVLLGTSFGIQSLGSSWEQRESNVNEECESGIRRDVQKAGSRAWDRAGPSGHMDECLAVRIILACLWDNEENGC